MRSTRKIFQPKILWRCIRDTKDVADKIAAGILERYHARNDKTKPLVVLLGEAHPNVAHVAANFRTIQRLHEHFDPARIAVAMEHSYSAAVQAARDHVGDLPKPARDFNRCVQSVTDMSLFDQRRVWLSMSTESLFYTAHLRRAMNASLIKSGTPIIYNDLPCDDVKFPWGDPDIFLTRPDPYLDRAFTHFRNPPRAAKAISIYTKLGIQLRNLTMRDIAADYLKDHQPDIFVQICGNAHVAGWGVDYPYSTSLSHLFARAGFETYDVVKKTKRSELPERKNSHLVVHPLEGPEFDGRGKVKEYEWLDFAMPYISLTGWEDGAAMDVLASIDVHVEEVLQRISAPHIT